MSDTKITYIEDHEFDFIDEPVNRRGDMMSLLPGQSQDGYGSKIITDRMVKFHGEKRQYRVYATCFSNVASNWIVKNGKKLHIRG